MSASSAPTDPAAECLATAHGYIARRVAVVPMRPALSEGRAGKPSPIPWVKWQAEGPLRRHREVEEFWAEHPDAQLAILLEKGLAAVDVDLKHLPEGRAPPAFPLPAPFPGGYVESTKSGGLHYLFRFRTPLDPSKAERVTGLGGFVDIFHGGLLIVAPSKFEGAPQGYAVVTAGGIPVFPTLREGLAASARWLAVAWEERWLRSKGSATASRPQALAPGGAAGSGEADAGPREVVHALDAVRADATVSRLFTDGARHPDGQVDRSLTEFRLAAWLKEGGFAEGSSWEIIRRCPHTKSPRDPRGFARFAAQVWDRLS